MNRLTTPGLLALVIAASACVQAQEQQFTAAGDLINADVWTFSDQQSISPQMLLRSAGADADGTAVVINVRQNSAYTESFYADSAESNAVLTPGDIVVFHLRDRQQTAQKNVVVAGRQTFVMKLAAGGNQLGNLLASLNLPIAPGIQIPVIRTADGRDQRLMLPPEALLVHGDVLMLKGVSPPGPPSKQLIHTVSANTTPAEPVSATPIETAEASNIGPLMLPGQDSPSDDQEESPLSADVALASSAALLTDLDATGMNADLTDEVRPETASVNAASSPPVWNAVFAVGLIGALTLIVSGWWKTKREIAETSAAAADVYASQSAMNAPTAAQPVTASLEPEPAADMKNTLVSSWTTDAGIPHEVPVSDYNTTEQLSDRLTVGEQPAATHEFLAQGMPEMSGGEPMPSPQTEGSFIREDEWFGGRWKDRSAAVAPAESVELDPVPPVMQSLMPVPPLESAPEQKPAISEPQTNHNAVPPEMGDLEDLIQNRLPVDLKQADLPLKVTLFGRPAGPRRLRIDAAHKEIAPPNFAAASAVSRSSKEQHTVTVAATDQQRVQSMMPADGVDSQSQPRDADVTSLDRALNSLHGQGH